MLNLTFPFVVASTASSRSRQSRQATHPLIRFVGEWSYERASGYPAGKRKRL